LNGIPGWLLLLQRSTAIKVRFSGRCFPEWIQRCLTHKQQLKQQEYNLASVKVWQSPIVGTPTKQRMWYQNLDAWWFVRI
jgi:hypothetical protein